MRSPKVPLAIFFAFWLLAVGDMTWTYLSNPHDPTLTGTDRYGHTYPGELARILTVAAGEIIVLLAILRPWTYRRSWGRALLAFAVLSPWLLLWGAVGLHAGPTTHAHTAWLLLLWLGLLGAALFAFFRGPIPQVDPPVGRHN